MTTTTILVRMTAATRPATVALARAQLALIVATCAMNGHPAGKRYWRGRYVCDRCARSWEILLTEPAE